MNNPNPNPSSLSLSTVAAWQLPVLVSEYGVPRPAWVGALPSLQRDAVWKPSQVELVWDSIFRGFPIGSVVISEALEEQQSRYGKLAGARDPWPDRPKSEKRHLLDGQQRSNAIALGFYDPFAARADEGPATSPGTILWIDLLPRAESFQSGGTRHYLFRVTTTAHPWGYRVDDETNPLSAHDMQQALHGLKTECGWRPPASDPYQRPAAMDLWPVQAQVPIPVAWLLQEACLGRRGAELWEAIRERCQKTWEPAMGAEGEVRRPRRWARRALEALAQPEVESLAEIEEGVLNTLRAVVPVLEVSARTIRARARREREGDEQEGEQNLSNIEHLFQRLNNGGTTIQPEELQYSMIKAYWPGIETTIGGLLVMPMRASRLALLGARAALAMARPEGWPNAMGIPALRQLAQDPKRADKRGLLERYFELPGAEVASSAAGGATLSKVIALVEEWLLYRGEDDPGFPPVLRTAVAHRSPELYLLLMILAGRVQEEGSEPEDFRHRVLTLTGWLHWFSINQHKLVQQVYQRLRQVERLTPEFFLEVLGAANPEQAPWQRGWLEVYPPDRLGEVMKAPTVAMLAQWRWWQVVVGEPSQGDPARQAQLEQTDWAVVWRVRDNRELLLFAQRKWLATRFRAYDRANAEAWEGHNCPWDYDHLLAQTNFHGVRSNPEFLGVCKEWGNTMGNFHVLPFEENRSRGGHPANEALAHLDPAMMLVEPEGLDPFSITRDCVRRNGARVLEFVLAARARLLRLYEAWYRSLDLAVLTIVPTVVSAQVVDKANAEEASSVEGAA